MPFRNDEKCFSFHLKRNFRFSFRSDFFGHIGKWVDMKAKEDLKIYDVTNCNIKSVAINIARYLKN